ncbi:MAG: L,D-transpeptidase [Bacteroidales bacterium]|nr:L,D-transpeptidase [Bacteroidales bacterium]
MKQNNRLNRSLLVLLSLLLLSLSAHAQGPYAKFAKEAGSAPFIVVDKPTLQLTLADAEGNVIKQYGMSCSKVYGPKQVRGDNKTPEGKFKINELLYAKGIPHDFGDGKGPIKDAYGPWFLRLDVPGFRDIGIHGTPFPESIGTRATEGCIRLANEDIVDLKNRVKLGTVVFITPDPEETYKK